MATVGIVAIGLVWIVLGAIGSLMLARDHRKNFDVTSGDVIFFGMFALGGACTFMVGVFVTTLAVLDNFDTVIWPRKR